MGRSRYKFSSMLFLYFLTCAVVGGLPVFTRMTQSVEDGIPTRSAMPYPQVGGWPGVQRG
ncbi:hypothetical protein SAMN05444166_0558 [Singulisphaera sp. GP187]|nr:hypothetical protein SAMN05444166_0558 [Singulisphaera sp. GP187]